MNKLLECCKSNGYSLSLTNFLVDLFDNYSTNTSIDEQENFLNALINTKIVLVGSIEEFIITIKNKLYDEIGYEMSSGEELAMTYMYRQKGIYLPIPNIKSNTLLTAKYAIRLPSKAYGPMLAVLYTPTREIN